MVQSNSKQALLKSLLIIQTVALLVYTGFAVKNESWTLLQVILDNITSLSWNGQFSLDFSCYLTLSAIWIMWRNKFTVTSILLGVLAMIIGIIVFAPYLLFLLVRENGDLKKLLIGNR